MNLIVSIGSILAGALCILTAFDSYFWERPMPAAFWGFLGFCAIVAGVR